MYLFNKKREAIEVYEMEPQEDLMASYRRKEIEEKIPLEERVYYAVTSNGKPLLGDKPITSKALNFSGHLTRNFFREVHTFKPMQFSAAENEQILDAYVNGAYNDNRAVKVVDVDKYYVLPSDGYKYRKFAEEYWMKGIVQVPESLYLLQRMSQGDFSEAMDKDVDDLFCLFALSQDPVYLLDRFTLEKMYESGLMSGAIDGIMDKVRKSSRVLKRVRKSQRR